MYAEAGLLFPYFQNFSPEIQQSKDFFRSHDSNVSMSSKICEFDMVGEGDLFKAPELIIEEPLMSLDPISAAMSMISCDEDDIITSRALKVADFDSLESEQLLTEAYYGCEKDLTSLSEVLDIKTPEENQIPENKPILDVPFQKSVSSEQLNSMEWMQGTNMKPNFLDFQGMDFSVVYGMRRAFSEGDIETLGNGNVTLVRSLDRPFITSNCTSEERKEKLSRYRNKKAKRNFGRKIKYACRKALADSQPRVRGRFAKSEESDVKRE